MELLPMMLCVAALALAAGAAGGLGAILLTQTRGKHRPRDEPETGIAPKKERVTRNHEPAPARENDRYFENILRYDGRPQSGLLQNGQPKGEDGEERT